jgi:hypothetical protein
VGLDGTGKGGAEKDPEDDEDEDDDEGDGDPAAVAPKIIFFGRESPKDVLKCFFLFLFLEKRDIIVRGASPLSSSLSTASCEDFEGRGAESKGTAFAGDTKGTEGSTEPRSCAFFRRRRRLREWVEGFPRPGGTGMGMGLDK